MQPSSGKNISIGQAAGRGSSTPADNTGSYNVFFGHYAANSVCTGSCNVAIGCRAANSLTTGNLNVFLGSYAGHGDSAGLTGSCNNAIGKHAGKCLTSGSQNNFLGTYAGRATSTGCYNNFIGYAAAYSNTTGIYNNFIGGFTGYANQAGCHNNFIGACAGRKNTNGNYNNFLGHDAGFENTTGCYNVFLGTYAGDTNTTGCCNIAIGRDVELPSTTGNHQFAIGDGTNRWIAGDSSFNVTLTGAPGTGIVTAYTGAGLHVSGIVTATSFEGDGSALTGISAGGGSGEFNTGITSSIQIKPISYEIVVHTFPSTAGRQYVIESISVANIDTSVGVGTTVNIIASIEDATAAEQTYIAYNVPIVNGGLIELLKNPIVAGPSDVIKMWTTNSGYIGTSNAVDVYMNYTDYESTEYKKVYAANTTLNTADETDIYTSTTYPTVFESIHFANRTDSGDYPVTIKITNGATTSYLAKDLIIPRYSTVDILDRQKRIETNSVITVSVGQTGTVDVILAGKQITS
jgi:hypothetical protein